MTRESRSKEVRSLLALDEAEVIERAGARLIVTDTLYDLHRHFAREVAAEIRGASAGNRMCRLILPVGPTGGYPHLVRIVRDERLDLSRCRFFFMDEYAVDGKAVAARHPLSFKGEIDRLFLAPLRGELRPDSVCFPDEHNVADLSKEIAEGGGIDACFGGVGIHGHLAFNEPQPGVAESEPRLVALNDFTVTINAVRASVGGNIECFPREAYTLGMRQILGSRRIVLYVRNGCEFDWANTVLRLALFGSPGEDYPVTLIRDADYTIVTDRGTLRTPVNRL